MFNCSRLLIRLQTYFKSPLILGTNVLFAIQSMILYQDALKVNYKSYLTLNSVSQVSLSNAYLTFGTLGSSFHVFLLVVSFASNGRCIIYNGNK